MTSNDSNWKMIYEGINGETRWILITEHLTVMNDEDVIISKAYPITWIEYLINQYPPTCNNKYIHLDQGCEMINNPDVNNHL